ncbi:hypothetical protein DL93DRAFT_2089951, partial [Clavulina sp. PMI_390]
MFASKPGTPKKRLRIHADVDGEEQQFQFSFTSPPAIADAELEKFKNLLATVVKINTSGASTPSATPKTAAPTLPPTTPATPTPRSPYPQPPTPYSRSPSAGPSREGRYSSQVYQNVLLKNPELATLHHALVLSGAITEQEFWEGREALLDSEASMAAQRKGKSSEIVAPRLKTGENGQILLTLTPQLLSDIFEEFPIVLQAYSDNVPNSLTEAEFWERYFSSKLFDRHRASSRNSVAKEDAIFDRYLEKEDDDVEPLRPTNRRVQLMLDLEATEGDHGETGNDRDVTMRAGRRKNAVPIIRRFNEHSERLLQSALGDSATSRAVGDEPKDFVSSNLEYNQQIDIDDLHAPDASEGIALNLANAQSFIRGGSETPSAKAKDGVGDAMDIDGSVDETLMAPMIGSIDGWSDRLTKYQQPPGAGDAALNDMTSNVNARQNTNSRKDELPAPILAQVVSCATSTNEFLRQFWSAAYPPIDSGAGAPLVVLTPAQREAKMTKMAGHIAKARERIGAVVLAAQHAGVELSVVQAVSLSHKEKKMALLSMANPPYCSLHHGMD